MAGDRARCIGPGSRLHDAEPLSCFVSPALAQQFVPAGSGDKDAAAAARARMPFPSAAPASLRAAGAPGWGKACPISARFPSADRNHSARLAPAAGGQRALPGSAASAEGDGPWSESIYVGLRRSSSLGFLEAQSKGRVTGNCFGKSRFWGKIKCDSNPHPRQALGRTPAGVSTIQNSASSSRQAAGSRPLERRGLWLCTILRYRCGVRELRMY